MDLRVRARVMRVKNLTIMFTDIAGYTELSQRIDHEQLEELLREHEAIVRAQAAECSGRVVKNLGDSFLIVYESVRDALNTAAAIHSRISERNRQVAASLADVGGASSS